MKFGRWKDEAIVSTKWTLKERWRVVRGNNLPAHLRHVLLVLMFFQGKNRTAWCKRETLAAELGISVRTVSHSLRHLEELKVARREWKSRGGRPSREYSIDFNELQNHQRSVPPGAQCTLQPIAQCSDSTAQPIAPPPCNPLQPHPATHCSHEVFNEVSNEHTCPKSEFSDIQTAEFIWDLVHQMQPSRKAPNLTKWANTIRLMRERDSRTHEQIRDLFRRANQDEFWQTNVLSPDKLRAKWDDLTLKLVEKRNGTACPEFDLVQKAAARLRPGSQESLDQCRAVLPKNLFDAARPFLFDINDTAKEANHRKLFIQRLRSDSQ